MNIENQSFVQQDTALESMRASDFDCYSAYGEVIDNSIQAFATDIRIEIEHENRSNSAKKINRVLFCDNGTGMDIELLHRCLKLGHSSRFNDRKGIGRFGVGMTLGAIHECEKIEVYSKQNNNWLYTYLDLVEISKGDLEFIPRPVSKVPKDSIVKYLEKSETGTLVIWSKYDNQVEKYETIIEESKFWIGRTFRRFIWGEATGYSAVTIKLNGDTIKAYDPLFVNRKFTGFEYDDKAELTEPQVISWPIPEKDLKIEGPQNSNILINISLLPDSIRRYRLQGGDEFAELRRLSRNEGISILRNDREVFFGHIPNFKLHSKSGDKEIDRFIGCEINFEAELDKEFAVKNIKRGAIPIRELKNEILERIKPTFISFRESIRNRWNEIERLKQDELVNAISEIGISSSHATSNAFLKSSKEILLKGDRAKKDEIDKKIARKILPEATDDEIMRIIDGLKENGITVDEKEFIGDSFIDMDHGNNLKTLFYNTNSLFYQSYKDILEELSKSNRELATKYKVLIDLIFVGYMLAESKIDPEETQDGSSFVVEMKHNWAVSLSKILKKWNQ